jgi:hypothetical protein
MGLKKDYPRSDDGRDNAMTIAKKRKDDIGPSQTVLSDDTCDKLDELQPKLIANRADVKDKEQTHANAVLSVEVYMEKMKSKVSHGLQLVVFKVVDKDTGFTEDILVLYNMPKDGRLPNMGSEEEIIEAANNFIDGETKRVALGGNALSDIRKADVQAMMDHVVTGRTDRQSAKDDLISSQAILQATREQVDLLIRQMWGDIEHAAQNLSKGARHDFGETWGMSFVHVPGYGTLNVQTLDSESKLPLAGVSLRIGAPDGKSGSKAVTNEHGEQILESRNFKPTHIVAEYPLYQKLALPITLVEDEEVSVVMHLVKKPKNP